MLITTLFSQAAVYAPAFVATIASYYIALALAENSIKYLQERK